MKEKILALGNYEDAMYHSFHGVDERLRKIFPDKELICTDDTSQLLHLETEHYTGIISYLDIWNGALTSAEANSLRAFVEQGGALLLLHNGISIQSRQELELMMGGKFLTHPPMTEITFLHKPHVITEGCMDFGLSEEPYQFELTEDNKEVFLVYLYHDKEYTAGWSKCVGKGRLVFLTPGHTPEIFDCPEYVTLIQKSMEWCLNRL